MAYDEELAGRIRKSLADRVGIAEKAMFGGLAYLWRGKMFCGIVKDELMVRVGKERHAEAIGRPHARTMDFTGRPMEGYVFVAAPGVATAKDVKFWVKWGMATAEELLRKPVKVSKRRGAARIRK